jgi:hypothetical protein
MVRQLVLTSYLTKSILNLVLYSTSFWFRKTKNVFLVSVLKKIVSITLQEKYLLDLHNFVKIFFFTKNTFFKKRKFYASNLMQQFQFNLSFANAHCVH